MRVRIPLLLASLAATIAQAWGPTGHRQIADIAWSQLTPTAKRAIARILMSGDTVTSRGGEHVYFVPNQPITNSFLENTVRPIFAESANWCDVIKGGQSEQFESRIDKDNRESPGVHPPRKGNLGEEARDRTWHYYDKPITRKGDSVLHPARDSNAVRALNLRIAELNGQVRRSKPDRLSEAYCLYWIEHIVGDLHQPLHCVSDYRTNPKGDEGGNRFKLGIPNPYKKSSMWNLHGYWDSGIDHAIAADPRLGVAPSAEQVTAQWLKDKADLPSRKDAANLNALSWVDRGWRLAIDSVYNGIEPNWIPSQGYADRQAALCKRQALLAGFRLAHTLNRALSKPPRG